jgi:hypothetical protein
MQARTDKSHWLLVSSMGIFTNLFAPKAREKPSGKKEIVSLTGGPRVARRITH